MHLLSILVFGNMLKKFLNTSNNILPSFSKEVCTSYFKNRFEEDQAKFVFSEHRVGYHNLTPVFFIQY